MNNHISLGLLVVTISLMVSVTAYMASDDHTQGEPGYSNLNNHSSTISNRIDQLLSSYEMMGFSSAIIEEHEGRIVLRKGYGLADRDNGFAYTPDTFQDILSVSKSFTGAAILSLESMGKLNLQDPITKFFSDVPDDKKSITIHQLLIHQSGLVDVLGPDVESIERNELVARAKRSQLRFEPGTSFAYSNIGYSLLGAIIKCHKSHRR